MNAKELIRSLMSEKEISNAELAEMLGISQGTFWARLDAKKSNNMTVSRLNEMLSKMDCKLIVKDAKTGKEVELTDGIEHEKEYDLKELLEDKPVKKHNIKLV